MAGYVARLVLIKAEIMTVVYKQLCTIESSLKVAPSIQRHRNVSFETMRVKGLFLKAARCWARIREHVDLVCCVPLGFLHLFATSCYKNRSRR